VTPDSATHIFGAPTGGEVFLFIFLMSHVISSYSALPLLANCAGTRGAYARDSEMRFVITVIPSVVSTATPSERSRGIGNFSWNTANNTGFN
jgi:hypothetical protein